MLPGRPRAALRVQPLVGFLWGSLGNEEQEPL